MYEILSQARRVNGKDVETWRRQITDCNILEVEAGTTGYCGGDTGHGGRTYLRIMDLGSTDLTVRLLKGRLGCSGVEIALGGDSELSTFIEALEFAITVLRKERRKGGETL